MSERITALERDLAERDQTIRDLGRALGRRAARKVAIRDRPERPSAP